MILTEEECVEISVKEIAKAGTERRGVISSVGTLLTTRPFNSYALQATMKGASKLKGSFVFTELRKNLFLFQFGSEADRDKVIKGGPWAFDKSLLALMEPSSVQPSQIVFDEVPFWIRIYDLPINMQTKETAEAIGNIFGGIIEDDDLDYTVCSKFMRLRVMVNIRKPLRRGLLMKSGYKKIWVEIKYERLPNFCYV